MKTLQDCGSNFNADKKNRDLLIDILKGFAIYLVCWGHTMQVFGEDTDFLNYGIGKFICIFHMPLFFFMSSLVGIKSLEIPFSNMIKKKTKSLLIPLLCFSLLQFSIYLVKDISIGKYLSVLSIMYSFSDSIFRSYWFIITLFSFYTVSNLAYNFTHRRGQRILLIIGVWVISLCIPVFYIPYREYVTYFQGMYPFFILGCVFKEYGFYIFIKKHSQTIVIMAILLLILVINYTEKDNFIYYQSFDIWKADGGLENVLRNLSWLVMGGFIGIVASISFFSYFYKSGIFNFLISPGQQTLAIYLVQGVVYSYIMKYSHYQIHDNFIYFVISIGLTLIFYGISNILRKTKIGMAMLGLPR